MRVVAIGDTSGQALEREHRRIEGLVHDVCAAVEQLGMVAGTSIVREGEPLMRAWRDLIAVRTHYLLGRDRTANNVGRILLGQEPTSRN